MHELSLRVEQPQQLPDANEVDGIGFGRWWRAFQAVPGGKLCPVMLEIPISVGPHQHVQKFEMARLRLTLGELALEGPCQGGNVFGMERQECSGHRLSSRSADPEGIMSVVAVFRPGTG